MDRSPNAPRSLILSTRLYQALLGVYPSEFRQAYGGLMLQVFRDSCRRVLSVDGLPGLLWLWWRTMLDTVQTAIEEHAQQGVDMSKEKFVRLCGWALILSVLALALSGLASLRPEYNQFNARSMPIDRYINAAELPLMITSLLLLSLGFIGLFLQYGQRAGSFGRTSLGLGTLSGLVSVVGAIGLGINEEGNPWWSIFFFGMVFQFLGLALFGIANLRQRLLSRWNGLPVITGIWIPLWTLLAMIIELASGRWVEVPPAVSMSLLTLTLAGLAGLGYVLQSDTLPARGEAAAV